jgi:predicted GNAT family acetyltransferase
VSGPVRNNTALGRFEQDLEDGVAFATYRLSPHAVTILHTEVPAATRESGVGSQFVRRVLEEIRAQGLKVVPQCSFVQAFITKNPEFNDLLS